MKKEIKLKNGLIITLCTAEIADAKNYAEYSNRLHTETPNLSHDILDGEFTEEKEIKYISSMNDSGNLLLLAKLEGKIVGHGQLCKRTKTRVRHRCDIGIGVLKDYWGNGIAGKIMYEMIEFAKSEGLEQINLAVIGTNDRAHSMYSSFGFKEIGTFPKAMKYADGTYADEIFMVKEL